MPKIIENLEARLIEEAKNQLETAGYGKLTIRSIAAACGVGVGTVYNYFPSKDELVAAYMLSDWKECVTAIQVTADNSDSPAPVVRCIYDQLIAYAERHQAIFRDETAAQTFAGSFTPYHSLLRSQLAAPLKKYCDDFAAAFIAESLLTWSMAGKSFDALYSLISRLF